MKRKVTVVLALVWLLLVAAGAVSEFMFDAHRNYPTAAAWVTAVLFVIYVLFLFLPPGRDTKGTVGKGAATKPDDDGHRA